MLQECVPAEGVAEALYYVCGPPQMVDSTVAYLKEIGAPPERIRVEKYD
jgi:NAD(P)H-flavin reductase